MKLLNFTSILTLSFISVFILSQCGSNPAEEGEQAFQKGNYNLAIKFFLEARKKDSNNTNLNEMTALAYMYRGEELFNNTKNIKSFSGNFDKATEFIPENPSTEFKKNYSKILFALAKGYNNSKPQNDIEKEDFLNKSISYLEEAIYQDESNSQAMDLLQQIKSENFQKMLERGKDFYSKAVKQNKNDLFFTAEYYFKKAAYFDIHNEEAKKLLSKTREKTLSILNIQEDLAIAVADHVWDSGNLILDLVLHNYGRDPIDIDINNFELFDLEGNSYSLNMKVMSSKFANKRLKNNKLAEMKGMEGYLAFNIPKTAKIEYLGYKLNDEKVVKKYFP